MDLSLDLVTGKLATLMAITAPKRSSELGLLDLNFSKKKNTQKGQVLA